jgi:hypothetical protein
MQALVQVCVPLCLFANRMPKQEWIYGFFVRNVKSYISWCMKVNLTLLSEIYVAWCLRRSRIESTNRVSCHSFFVVNYSPVIWRLSQKKQMDSQSIKELSEYMMNCVIFVTESSENANKRVHILILIFVKTVHIPCFKTLSIQGQAICIHCSFRYTILSQHFVAFEFARLFLCSVERKCQ